MIIITRQMVKELGRSCVKMPIVHMADGTVTQYNAAIGTSGHSWQTVS